MVTKSDGRTTMLPICRTCYERLLDGLARRDGPSPLTVGDVQDILASAQTATA
jgi:hypothetical protein